MPLLRLGLFYFFGRLYPAGFGGLKETRNVSSHPRVLWVASVTKR